MSRSQGIVGNYEAAGRYVFGKIAESHADYANLSPETHADVLAANISNARIYYQTISQQKKPTAKDMAFIIEAARRRVHQGITLEGLLRSYRVGIQVLWGEVARDRPDFDAAMLTEWTLQYVDWVSTSAAAAYIDEQAEMTDSQRDRTRFLVTQIVEDDFFDDSQRASALTALGLDLGSPYVAVTARLRRRNIAGAPDIFRNIAAVIERTIPRAVGAVLRRGTVHFVPASAPESLVVALTEALDRQEDGAAEISLGLGRPTMPERGLKRSLLEAERAHALGGILKPGAQIHSYESIELLDLFREDERVEEFVRTVLGEHLTRQAGARFDLVRTLYVYFTMGMNRSATARRLHIHPNTLDYRLRQIADNFDTDLSSPELSFRYQLAVRLLPLCRTPTILDETGIGEVLDLS